jgi:Fe-S-cluster containining protein
MAEAPDKENICINCGLCCDGSLYSRVRLKDGDDGETLMAHGLDLAEDDTGRFFAQPCPRFAGGCCTIYADRPTKCRTYRCKLRHRYDAGTVSAGEAKSLIRAIQAFDPANNIRPGLAVLAGHQSGSIKRLLRDARQAVAGAENPTELRRRHGEVLMRAMVMTRALEKDFINDEEVPESGK